MIVDIVKDGVIELNETTTIGKALDNWKTCKKTNWSDYKTDSDIRVVEFSCEFHSKPFMNKVKSSVSDEDKIKGDHLDVESIVQKFKFTINTDDTFQVDSSSLIFSWSDGKVFKRQLKLIEELEIVYENHSKYDPDMINKVRATRADYQFSRLKLKAK